MLEFRKQEFFPRFELYIRTIVHTVTGLESDTYGELAVVSGSLHESTN